MTDVPLDGRYLPRLNEIGLNAIDYIITFEVVNGG